eukprot:scaffold61975_cov21-Tisochrysis_lutea.AAC.1
MERTRDFHACLAICEHSAQTLLDEDEGRVAKLGDLFTDDLLEPTLQIQALQVEQVEQAEWSRQKVQQASKPISSLVQPTFTGQGWCEGRRQLQMHERHLTESLSFLLTPLFVIRQGHEDNRMKHSGTGDAIQAPPVPGLWTDVTDDSWHTNSATAASLKALTAQYWARLCRPAKLSSESHFVYTPGFVQRCTPDCVPLWSGGGQRSGGRRSSCSQSRRD